MKKVENDDRYEKVPVEEENKQGLMVHNIGADLASADPMVYARLLKAGKYKEAEKMVNTPMYRLKKKK